MSGLRLLHPGGFRRASNSSSSEDELPPPNTNRVKRALFGPTDHEENLRFVQNELKKHRSEASNRWNFDFDAGKPMSGPFDWEEVRSDTAGRTICNPEKHSLIATDAASEDVSEAKENRVGGQVSGPQESQVSEVQVTSSSGDTVDILNNPAHTQDDLKTPPSSTQPSQSSSSVSISSSESSSQPSLHHGARPKELTQAKEKKMTELFRSRKPKSRSKSSSKLKRLAHEGGGGARSPSVKSRIGGPSSSKEGDNSSKKVPSSSLREQSIPVTVSRHDDSSSSD